MTETEQYEKEQRPNPFTKVPSFYALEWWFENGHRVRDFSNSFHHNPRFYKYYWWIFHRGSPCEGEPFRTRENRLSRKIASDFMDDLDRSGEPYWIYIQQLPRVGSPFDPASKKWKDVEWAPRLEEDTDEEIFGHK